MSKLSSARDQLKRQMLRVELITKVVDYAGNLPNETNSGDDFYQDVAEEVAKLFSDFAERSIDPRPQPVPRQQAPAPEATDEEEAQTQPNPAPSNHDQIASRVQFMQQYRPFADKMVRGKTSDGVEITGRLTSIDFPYLVIKDESKGMKFQVQPETIKLIGD